MAIAWAVNRVWPAVSPLTTAVVLGVVAANVLPDTVLAAARPGLQVAAKRVMRLGIVLLGLQLALGDVLHLGWRTLAFVVAAVFATFFGTQWLGRRLGLPGRQPLLIATGFAICGASAVAAMEGVTRRPGADEDDPDPVVAVALVTLCGSLAILVLPLLRGPLGLTGAGAFGHWVGASVHDVGQVVATAGAGGPAAVNGAVVVKLMRVAMLAPIVAGTAVVWRRRAGDAPDPGAGSGTARATATALVGASAAGGSGRLGGSTGSIGSGGSTGATASVCGVGAAASVGPTSPTGSTGPVDTAPTAAPPLLPLFVAAFLAMIALRTTGVLPASVLSAAKQVQDLLLAAGMFGLGSGVRVRELGRTGPRPLALGLASWALIAGAAYIGVRLSG
ncbi:hypothetical protein GCM10009838_73330 [Catenulispora subtropica]|uniref:Sulfate exporter family transporter n=1 Tax=Catenulispora subtropica TaxID=450798 RepID=A0ABN2T3I3_9ACTN